MKKMCADQRFLQIGITANDATLGRGCSNTWPHDRRLRSPSAPPISLDEDWAETRHTVCVDDDGPLDNFSALLASLDPDPIRGWQAYEDLRNKLKAYFEHNHCVESEELADEALYRIAIKPDVRLLKNIVEFAFGVARNLRKEAFRETSLRVDVPDWELFEQAHCKGENSETRTIKNIETREKMECFQNCLQDLPAEDRELIRQYYPAEGENLEQRRQQLAIRHGLSAGALRTRVARIRERLERLFNRTYYSGRRKTCGKRKKATMRRT